MAWMIHGGGGTRYIVNAGLEFENTLPRDEYEKIIDSLWLGQRLPSEMPRPVGMRLNEGGIKRLPELMGYLHTFIGQKSFVDLVESFEPGVHEWMPVRMWHYKTPGEYHPETYYILNICNWLRSVVLDDRSVRVEEVPSMGPQWRMKSRMIPKVRKELAQTHHVWRDAGSRRRIFVSNAFKAALEDFMPERKGWYVSHEVWFADVPLEEV